MPSLDMLREPLWQPLTWALIHFLWQGLAVAVAAVIVLHAWPVRSANARYLIYLSALIAMAVCPLVTLMRIDAPAPAEVAVVNGEAETERSSPPMVDPNSGAIASEIEFSPVESPNLESHQPAKTAEVGKSPDLAPAALEEAALVPAPAPGGADLRRSIEAIQPYALSAWFAGVILLAMRLSLSWLHVRWLATGRRMISDNLAEKAAVLGERLRLKYPPCVFVTNKTREAIVVGLWRPLVLLPASWLTEMPLEVLEAVIAHELAHIRRLDLWANLLQRLIETLLFYHPVVWWLSRRVSLEREMCADELAVGATRERLAYATALEQLGRMRLGQTSPQLGAGIGGDKMVLLDRVGNILGLSSSNAKARWWPVGLLAIAVPLAVWLASTSLVSSTENEIRAEKGEPSISVKLDKADLQRWVEKANSPVPSEFDAAVDALVAMGPGVAPEMIPLLKTGRTDRLGIKVLESLAPEPSVQRTLVQAIEEARRDRSPNVVHCALIALGKSGNVAHADFIATFLKTNDLAAMSALATLGGERARDHLIGAFDLVATDHWFTLVGALERLGDPAAVPEIKKRLGQVELPPNDRFPPATVGAMTGAIATLSGEKETFTTTQYCQGQHFLYPFGGPGTPKTFSVNPLRDHYVRLPKVDPESEEGRKAIWKAMEEATEGPGFTIDGNEVVAFHGLKMAPLWPEGRPYPITLYDWLRRTSHQVLHRLIDQEKQTGRCAIPEGGLLVTLDPAGRLYVLSLKRTSDQFTYNVTVMPQNPNMQLIPLGEDVEGPQYTERIARLADQLAVDNPLGLDDATLINLYSTGKALEDESWHCAEYYRRHDRMPEVASKEDPFAPNEKLRIVLSEEVSGLVQIWSVGPDGDWDSGRPIDSTQQPLDGDLGVEMNRDTRAPKEYLTDETMRRHLAGDRLSHYLAAKGPKFPKPELEDDGLKWGPVVDGLQLAVELLPKKEAHYLGESIDVRFRVRNAADYAIKVGLTTNYHREGAVFIHDENGNRLNGSSTDLLGLTGIEHQTLKPGETVTYDSADFALVAPGRSVIDWPVAYKAEAAPGIYTLRFLQHLATSGGDPLEWVGELETAPVTIRIAEHPKFALHRVAGYIDRSGSSKHIYGLRDSGNGPERDPMRLKKHPLDDLVLDGLPLVTEQDIVSYDWEQHILRLTPEAHGRLMDSIQPQGWGIPFVVQVEGQPVYQGTFWKMGAKYSRAMPGIALDLSDETLPENAIRIDGPVSEEGEIPGDSRSDERVHESLLKADLLTRP